jgi:dTDP-4-dehydrorhamnose reductase
MADLSRARVALIGSRGMLGRAFAAALTSKVKALTTYARPAIDLADPRSLERVFDGAPDWIVNCAAYTAVDRAEAEEPLATRVNGEAPRLLARWAEARGVRLVHFSTDYVFDGKARAPYPIDAPIAPINAYGRSKAEGERALREELPEAHLLIRTSWVYAPWGASFVRTIAGLAEERETIRVVDDQRGRPTSAERLAATTFALMALDARGTFHAADEGECSWYELARAIVHATGARCRVEPCSSDEFPRPAQRPAYSVLDLSRTHAEVGEGWPWRVAVAAALARAERSREP